MKRNGTALLSELIPCPENAAVYRDITHDDPATLALERDIRTNGILEPIVVTADNVILSGHRRRIASLLAGLTEVPIRRVKWCYNSQRDQCLRLLVSFNRQRVKNPAEQIREEAVAAADGEEAHRRLLAIRAEEARAARTGKLNHDSVFASVRIRARVSKGKQAFLAAARRIIDDNEEYWPLSVRQVHYRLLNDPPLIHSSKPDSVYRNDVPSYKALINLLTSARCDGEIPWEAIADVTRQTKIWNTQANLGSYMADQMRRLFDNYARDPLQSQARHIEILVEKNTAFGIVSGIAMRYRVPVMSARGFSSLAPLHDLAERFEQSGKGALTVLCVSDFDPSGEGIARHVLNTLRDDFMVEEEALLVRKVALTHDQVVERGLPPGGKAKPGDTRTPEFIRRFGDDVFELEALEPAALAGIVDEAVRQSLDIEAFNGELAAEKGECGELDAMRRAVLEVLRGF